MSVLAADTPVGRPSFALAEDQRATVVDLLCRGAKSAAALATPGMLEVPLTRLVRKCMRRVKSERGIGGVHVRGEHELDNMESDDPDILGRIDLTLQFLHQFDDEDAYVAIEAKRVGAGEATLNQRYVTEGVDRYVQGRYSPRHTWGFMLAFVLKPPVEKPIDGINRHLVQGYGKAARMTPVDKHPDALAVQQSCVTQRLVPTHEIRLTHVFMDMSAAA
jgi:hypothetical protein